jgi:hypothetical protein
MDLSEERTFALCEHVVQTSQCPDGAVEGNRTTVSAYHFVSRQIV